MSYTPAYKQNVTGTTTPVSIAPPPGSIMAFLGTGDPDGWIIMNGVARAWNDKYKNVKNMNIGTHSEGNGTYTPPNYTGAFLRGAGGQAPDAPNQSQDSAIKSHTHYASDDSFFKVVCQNGLETAGPGLDNADNQDTELSKTTEKRTYKYSYKQINLVTGFRMTDIPTSTQIQGSHEHETRPYNYSVNWILKL